MQGGGGGQALSSVDTRSRCAHHAPRCAGAAQEQSRGGHWRGRRGERKGEKKLCGSEGNAARKGRLRATLAGACMKGSDIHSQSHCLQAPRHNASPHLAICATAWPPLRLPLPQRTGASKVAQGYGARRSVSEQGGGGGMKGNVEHQALAKGCQGHTKPGRGCETEGGGVGGRAAARL